MERRSSPRYRLAGRAEVLGTEQTTFEAEVRDISLAGCYLETQRSMPVNARIILHLQIGGISPEFAGTVAWTEQSGFGVQFDNSTAA